MTLAVLELISSKAEWMVVSDVVPRVSRLIVDVP